MPSARKEDGVTGTLKNVCNRNSETRQKLCGAVRWYRAVVV